MPRYSYILVINVQFFTFYLLIYFTGYVYALGGHDGLSIFDSVERYDPSTDTWTEATSMLTRRLLQVFSKTRDGSNTFLNHFRCRLGVAILNGKLYACGGYDGSSFLQTVEVFDPNTNKLVYCFKLYYDNRKDCSLKICIISDGLLWPR